MQSHYFIATPQFRYLGTVTNQNLIREEIKSRSNLVNDCYHCSEPVPSCLLSKDIKINVYKTVILSVVLYGCETWSLTLREENRRKAFENRVLRRMFGPKMDEII
jgi:hypothetical protein